MSGYLDNFGVKEARREKTVKQVLYALLGLIVAGGAIWFFFRDFQEKSRVGDFLALLQRQDYKSAYAMWGCTEATPCRDYNMDQFLRDWGPGSAAATGIEKSKVKSCSGGIIQILKVKGQDVNLYVDRATRTLSFAPWPVCAPRIKL